MPASDTKEPGIKHLLGVDLRGLAFLRVGLALCGLFDLATRAADLYAHYTDYGVISRADLLSAFGWLHEWPLCLHMMSGSVEVQAGIFLLHAAAAIALLLGYQTRLATVLTWFLLSSVQLRNLLIGGGYDAVLRMLLLWGAFLPLGACFSLDNLRRDARRPQAGMVFSVGTVALLVQVVLIYWAAGYAKLTQEVWVDGEALRAILHDDFFATAFGRWLGESAALCAVFTRATFLLELGGPLLLIFSGWSAMLRGAVIGALCGMNLGFALALDVGLFPWVMSVAVLTFLPPSYWDRASGWTWARNLKVRAAGSSLWQRVVRHARRRGSAPQAANPPDAADGAMWLLSGRTRFIASQVVCAILLATVVHWNLGVARERAYSAPWYTTWIVSPLFLQQDWRMFADPSRRTGWIVMPARLVGGREIDLMAAGGRVPSLESYSPYATIDWTKPRSGLGRYANIRWRALLRHVLIGGTEPSAALLYGRYVCREWNGRYRGDEQLKTFQVVFVAAALHEPYDALQYTPEVAWTHDCFQ